jgi:hypothetical protein
MHDEKFLAVEELVILNGRVSKGSTGFIGIRNIMLPLATLSSSYAEYVRQLAGHLTYPYKNSPVVWKPLHQGLLRCQPHEHAACTFWVIQMLDQRVVELKGNKPFDVSTRGSK